MAVVFLLGPSMWEPGGRTHPEFSPMHVRRNIAKVFRKKHKVVLMEDDPDREGEDLIEKFNRLLLADITDVVVYWPQSAKMQTTYDEFLLLYHARETLNRRSIPVWMLHHRLVAQITRDEFRINESPRSRYLTAVVKLGVRPLAWDSEAHLYERVELLSNELD